MRENVKEGVWNEWLPAERDLCTDLQVSRNTLRRAIQRLRYEGLLEARQGVGTRIASRTRRPGLRRRAEPSVGIVMPRSLHLHRHFMALFVDELRLRLYDRGYRVKLHIDEHLFESLSDKTLEKLVHMHPHDCWILTKNFDMHRWFESRGLPAVISGITAPDVNLPRVVVDNEALGSHAVGMMVSRGHRRLAFLNTAGNPELKRGLQAGLELAQRRHLDIEFRFVEAGENRDSIAIKIRQLFTGPFKPTVLFLSESHSYLSAITALARMRMRVPEEVSLICRSDEPYMEYLLPAPAYYFKDCLAYSRRMVELIARVIEGGDVENRHVSIIPDFIDGKSLGPPPERMAMDQ